MAVFLKGKCSEETCKKEFEIENSGFGIRIDWNESSKELSITLGRVNTRELASHFDEHTCGKECLFKMISRASDKHLGVTLNDKKENGNGRTIHPLDTEYTEISSGESTEQV